MTETTVNIPLLRKAVEWAEAEAAKPIMLSSWYQGEISVSPQELGRSPECGTCYCIAGYVASLDGIDSHRGLNPGGRWRYAEEKLGLTENESAQLFAANNSISQVRRIAESIAGERL